MEDLLASPTRQSSRPGRRTDRQCGLNGDTVSAFVMARSRLSDNFGKEWYSPQLKITIVVEWKRLAAGPQDWLDSRLKGGTASAVAMARSHLRRDSRPAEYKTA